MYLKTFVASPAITCILFSSDMTISSICRVEKCQNDY